MAYAQNTSVPVERSRAEVEKLVLRYGADRYQSGWSRADNTGTVQFLAKGRYIKIVLRLPAPDDRKFTHKDPSYKWSEKRTEAQRVLMHQQEVRRMWRCLVLVIKSKLESVASGIESFEEAFLPWIMLPGGESVAATVAPMIREAYAGGFAGQLQLTTTTTGDSK